MSAATVNVLFIMPFYPHNQATQSMKWFRFFAWTAIALHVLGLFAALFGVRPGTAVFPVEQRMAWIQAGHQWWHIAWGIWLLAALSFIAFLTAVIVRFDLRGTITNLGLAVGVA